MRWKTVLNDFDITFDGRLSAARQRSQPPWYTDRLTVPFAQMLVEGHVAVAGHLSLWPAG
ncbi:hypothetical protein [Streptomyces sp. NBC_01727]|uniref:hypothetical protein n=1 Tax=Streptomyces sp. NBC_01727 TaxID=2975924 RepID=UPI002E10B8FD|nr:hypothetical protein OIE76_40635 [Streptomyces sp. NBC_01727]